MLTNQEKEVIWKRLKKYPNILERIDAVLDVLEDPTEKYDRADDAEMALIPEVRGIGKDLLEAWGVKKCQEKEKTALEKGYRSHSKKKSSGIPHLET